MMTPEEIQQVVEDYRKSNSLNEEIFSKKVQNFFRNFGRNPEDKVNVDKKNEKKNNNGAQGNGAQSSTVTGAQGTQGGNNDNVTVSGAQGGQGAQSSTVTGAQGAQGGQGPQNNTVKKNEIDLDAMSKYTRKGKEVTIKDFGGIKPTGAQGVQGAQTNEVKPKISPATFSTNQKQSRALVKSGELKDTDLNKYSRSNTYTADDGKTQVTRSTVNTIAQFDMGPNIKKGDKLGVISKNQRKKYDLQVANMNNKVEAYEPYHIVLGYVLSEGHAETVEEAHYVMGQMDSETIQEIVALDENLAANVARTAGVLTLGGMGLNAIRKMFQNKKKMDNDGEFTPGSTLDNIQKKNKMLKDLNTGNY